MKLLFIMFVLLMTTACATGNEKLGAEIGRGTVKYCDATSANDREIIRESANKESAPHTIKVNCVYGS
jgi:hypothetical protein